MPALLASCLVALLAAAPPPPAPPASSGPRLVLWVPEEAGSLGFLDPREAGVAHVVGTLTLRRDAVEVGPRRQALHVPPGTELTVVVRVECVGMPRDGAGVRARETADEILRLVLRSVAPAVLVDVSPGPGDRALLAELLRELRRRLPAKKRLEVAVPGAWCLDEAAMKDVPLELVSRVVPKVHGVQGDDARARAVLEESGDWPVAACRGAVGVLLDEPLPRLPQGARVVVRSSRPWTEADVAALRAKIAAPEAPAAR